MIVIKRDGRQEEFDTNKIINAIFKAAKDIKYELSITQTQDIIKAISERLGDKDIEVEKLQDIIESALYVSGLRKVKDSYNGYRKERTGIRDLKSGLMNTINSLGKHSDNDNGNVGANFSAKLLRIASESNKWHNLAKMPKQLAKAHESGDLYYHDLDSLNLTVNCLHIPTRQILQKGFNAGYGFIRPPKRIESAAELSCILLQASQNDMFGGQAHPNFDNDMAPFVELTRSEILYELKESYTRINNTLIINIEALDRLVDVAEEKVRASVKQAMQSIVYNLNSMASRAGSQVPFSSINIGIPESEDAALVCELFLLEYEKGLGLGEQPIFPNIIFRVKAGVNKNPNDPYYYLFKLACRVASKRMNPTFMNIDCDFNKAWYDKGIIPSTMGCRTYVMDNINGEPGTEGRGNIAPVTINLPRLGIRAYQYALEAHKKDNTVDVNKLALYTMFNYLQETLALARESSLYRYDVLKELKVRDLPFVVGQGLMKGSEGLSENDSIEPVLKQGTWGIGFIGLAETLTILTGKHHGESTDSQALGLELIGTIREFCNKHKEIDKLNWSCYATPAEGVSYKLLEKDKKIFGEIEGVTDKGYYTNSYHVPVGYPISIKSKIIIEAPYHKLCNAGHISYIELDNYPDGDTIENILNYAYDNTNINYIGINFHMRYCKDCGERVQPGENNCPKCNSNNIQGISRITGYLSLDERFGTGKVAERADRISHANGKKVYGDVK